VASASDGGPLAGRHAVVTGAGRGLGAAIAEEIARLGASVTLMGRTEAPLRCGAASITSRHGTEARAVRCDVTDQESVRHAFAEAREQLGPPLILVNNAGIAESAPFGRTDAELWRRVLDTDLTGAYFCAAEVVPIAIAHGWGRIVNIASTAGLRGYAYITAYCAAKHGLVGFTRALALETAKAGLTVNAVCPGYADTDLVAGAVARIVAKTGRAPEQARAELVRHNPQQRLIRPEEIARTVGWLCLPESASINGQAIAVDGGELA